MHASAGSESEPGSHDGRLIQAAATDGKLIRHTDKKNLASLTHCARRKAPAEARTHSVVKAATAEGEAIDEVQTRCHQASQRTDAKSFFDQRSMKMVISRTISFLPNHKHCCKALLISMNSIYRRLADWHCT
jgi:hypothetical protein